MIGKTNAGASKTGAIKDSVITVTYPEGSDCTVSNGSRTFRAPDTSGAAAFVVPVGEWTVKATDGSSTEEKTVSITAKGQVENVELGYELWIIKDGQDMGVGGFPASGPGGMGVPGIEYVDLATGGRAFRVHITQYSSQFTNTTVVASTTGAFDLSLYSKIMVRGWIVDNFNHETYTVAVQSNGATVGSVMFSNGQDFTTSEPTERVIDISEISSMCNIAITYSSYWVADGNFADLYIDQLRLIR